MIYIYIYVINDMHICLYIYIYISTYGMHDKSTQKAGDRLIKIINIQLGGKPHVAAVQRVFALYCKSCCPWSLPHFCIMNKNICSHNFVFWCSPTGEEFKSLLIMAKTAFQFH